MAGVLLLLSTDFQGGGGYLTAHARLDQLAGSRGGGGYLFQHMPVIHTGWRDKS